MDDKTLPYIVLILFLVGVLVYYIYTIVARKANRFRSLTLLIATTFFLGFANDIPIESLNCIRLVLILLVFPIVYIVKSVSIFRINGYTKKDSEYGDFVGYTVAYIAALLVVLLTTFPVFDLFK